MQSSSTTMRQSLNLSQSYRRPNSLTSYIFKQDQNDHHLSILLEMLTQFNSLIQLQESDKSKDKCEKLVKQLGKLDQRHRSYDRVRSLVNGSVLIVWLADGEVDKIQGLVDEEEDVCIKINSPEYLGKVYLLRVLILLIKSKRQQQPKLTQTQREIKKYYKKFQKIKFNSSDTYFDSRLWQSSKIIQILVYQYILLVQKLAEYDEYKSYFLYKRGLNIARRLLGRDHRFAKMMSKIMKIRKQTTKLIRLEPAISISTIMSSSNSRPKSLVHKKLNKILNPESAIGSHKAYSKIYTGTSYSMTRSKLAQSDRLEAKRQHNSKRLYTLQQQPTKKLFNIQQKQPAKKQKKQQNYQLQTILNNKLPKNSEQISSMLSKIGSRANSKVNNNVYISTKMVEKAQEDQGRIIYVEENQVQLAHIVEGEKGENGNQWNCQLI